MKVFDNIKNKSIDEFAEWLDTHGQFDGSPWMEWFDENYCQKCECENVYVEAFNRKCECAWCELHNKCRFFPNMNNVLDSKQIVKMWLESEV